MKATLEVVAIPAPARVCSKNSGTYQIEAQGFGRGALFAALFQGLHLYLLHVKEDNQ